MSQKDQRPPVGVAHIVLHTDRQRIKRQAANWGKRYQARPRAERLALLSALMAVEARETP